jgi:outer membrane protein TolC
MPRRSRSPAVVVAQRVSLMAALVIATLPTRSQATEPAPIPVMATGVGLSDMVSRLRSVNRTILSKKAEAEIAATGVSRAEGAFQPQVSLLAVRGITRQERTFEEALLQEDPKWRNYQRESNDFSVGLSVLIPQTGAKVEVKSALSRFITSNANLPEGLLRPEGAYDNRGSTGLTLTQPLARDAGAAVTQARVQVAKLDTTAAGHAGKDTESSVVAEGILAYYELVFAQQRVAAAQEKIQTSVRLLEEAVALEARGRLPQTDVWEVENALARYRSLLSEAEQNQRERANRLRTLLMMEASEPLGRAFDALPEVDPLAVIEPAQAMRAALERRDDYRMRQVMVERETVQVAYAQNQRLPRVDLVLGYGVSGLAYSAGKSLNWSRSRDFPNWSVGLQVQVPLGANRQAEADLVAALLRLEDARQAVEAMEIQMAHDIDTSLALRDSMVQRWRLWREVAEREERQLAAERIRFASGRSDTRELLLRQERVVNARLSVQEQQLGYARAQVLLQAAQGVLMERFP